MNNGIFRVLSWGGGTQSTALGEMSASGEIDRLDAIIFADTQFERQKTYEIVEFYTNRWRAMGMTVEIVTAGDIRRLGATEHIHIPFRTVSGAPLKRQCTSQFKINPVKRRVRELIGFHRSNPPHPKPGSVEQWIGFSWDEWHRMTDSRVKYIVERYPLIEMKMNRWDSIEYLKQKNLPEPILSACVICPFRSATEWLEMKLGSPGEFLDAIDFDELHRNNPLAKNGTVTSDQLFIYKHASPLSTANLELDAQREQTTGTQIPLLVCNGSQCWT